MKSLRGCSGLVSCLSCMRILVRHSSLETILNIIVCICQERTEERDMMRVMWLSSLRRKSRWRKGPPSPGNVDRRWRTSGAGRLLNVWMSLPPGSAPQHPQSEPSQDTGHWSRDRRPSQHHLPSSAQFQIHPKATSSFLHSHHLLGFGGIEKDVPMLTARDDRYRSIQLC